VRPLPSDHRQWNNPHDTPPVSASLVIATIFSLSLQPIRNQLAFVALVGLRVGVLGSKVAHVLLGPDKLNLDLFVFFL